MRTYDCATTRGTSKTTCSSDEDGFMSTSQNVLLALKGPPTEHDVKLFGDVSRNRLHPGNRDFVAFVRRCIQSKSDTETIEELSRRVLNCLATHTDPSNFFYWDKVCKAWSHLSPSDALYVTNHALKIEYEKKLARESVIPASPECVSSAPGLCTWRNDSSRDECAGFDASNIHRAEGFPCHEDLSTTHFREALHDNSVATVFISSKIQNPREGKVEGDENLHDQGQNELSSDDFEYLSRVLQSHEE